MGDVIKEAIKSGKAALRSQKRGRDWAIKALPAVVALARCIREETEAMKQETEPLQIMVKTAAEPYRKNIEAMAETYEKLRERIMKEYGGVAKISGSTGELVFQEKPTYEVVDINRVDKKYIMKVVNVEAVKEAIEKGATKIKGLNILPKRILSVRPFRPNNQEQE
jgi:hypothetical protein